MDRAKHADTRRGQMRDSLRATILPLSKLETLSRKQKIMKQIKFRVQNTVLSLFILSKTARDLPGDKEIVALIERLILCTYIAHNSALRQVTKAKRRASNKTGMYCCYTRNGMSSTSPWKILFPDEQGGIFPTFPSLPSGKISREKTRD